MTTLSGPLREVPSYGESPGLLTGMSVMIGGGALGGSLPDASGGLARF